MSSEIDWPASARSLALYERTSGRSVIAGFTVALGLVTAVAFLVHSAARTTLDAQSQLEHTRDAAAALDNVSSTINEMSLMQDRYLLTHSTRYSGARDADADAIGRQLHRLQALLPGESAQRGRLAALEPPLANFLSRFRAAGNTPPAARSSETDALSDNLSVRLADMRRQEGELLARQNNDLQHRIEIQPFIFIVLLLLAAASLCFAYSVFTRYVKQRGTAERADAVRDHRNAFVARARCDLRSSLTAILGYCDLPMESGTPAQERFDLIRRQANQLIAAANDLLNVPDDADAPTPPPDASRMDPLCPRKSGAAESSANQAPALRFTGRVLLAEDNSDLQQVIKFYLQAAGAEVTIADDGKQACERAMMAWSKQEPFDLILMDVQMPGSDGRSATILLRDAGYTHPIVALTANATAQERGRCLAAGCNGFLAKPVDQELFLRTMRRYLQPEAPSHSPAEDNAQASADAQFAEIRASFEAELPSRVAEIGTAVLAGNFARVADLAHQLKGTAGCFGLTPIYETAAALQSAAERPDRPRTIEKCFQTLTERSAKAAPVPAPAQAA